MDNVRCIDGVDGLTPDMLRYRTGEFRWTMVEYNAGHGFMDALPGAVWEVHRWHLTNKSTRGT